LPETNNPPAYWMEDEIDLRRYVEVMLRRWWWIIGCAVIAAVVAFAVGSLQPPTYQTSAVVIVTEPRYQVRLEPQIETVDQWSQAFKTFPTLATSDDVLEDVTESYQPASPALQETWSRGALKSMVNATSEGDPSLVKLSVTCNSPGDAAGIANAWADQLTRRGSELYEKAGDDVEFFQDRVAQSEQTLNEAQQDLVAFRAQDRGSILEAELRAHRQTQADYLAERRTLANVAQDAQALGDQLARQPSSGDAAPADELTALALQLEALSGSNSAPMPLSQETNDRRTVQGDESTSFSFEIQSNGGSANTSSPIQLQITDAGVLTGRTRGELADALEDLEQTLAAKLTAIDEQLTSLEPTILDLQEDLEKTRAEESRLLRARDLAEETATTLSRKLQEARIAAQEESGVLQVGSYAGVPGTPTGPQTLRNTALAAVVGGMLGLGAVFVWEWWNDDEED